MKLKNNTKQKKKFGQVRDLDNFEKKGTPRVELGYLKRGLGLTRASTLGCTRLVQRGFPTCFSVTHNYVPLKIFQRTFKSYLL